MNSSIPDDPGDAELDRYAQDPAFHEFIDREFDLMAAQAPLEDLIRFAFGGVREAIEAYKAYQEARGEGDAV